MATGPQERLPADDARKTYRYLRIGMIGAVVLLAASIAIERSKVDCWQTSISAYYYTPVRAIFVGSMLAVGLALIVYKGRSRWEDACLNVAGMLAPVVAVAPTTDVGRCWSVAPSPLPLNADGSLANWVVTNIDNNIYALLIAGAIAVAVVLIITSRGRYRASRSLADRPSARSNPTVRRSVDGDTQWTIRSLVGTAGMLVIGWLLIRNWEDFNTRAHGFAALVMFVFLIVAILFNVLDKKRKNETKGVVVYAGIAALMIAGGILISWTRVFDDHTVFALETYEISFFAIYWIAQTVEKWHEEVVPPRASVGGQDSGSVDAAIQ